MTHLTCRPVIAFIRSLRTTVFLLLALASAARATTYMTMEDSRLADQASAIALVTVTGIEPGPAETVPSTDYLVDVQRVVSGNLPGSAVVRVPGGIRADGVGFKVWGAPEFEIGEEALLFLVPDSDGSFQIQHLLLGAFHIREKPGVGKLALRDLSEAHRIDVAGESPEEPTRELPAFVEWLEDRAHGLRRAPDYTLRPSAGASALFESFTLMKGEDGISPRWFAFDGGKTIRWHSQPAGQPGLTPEQTVERLTRALAAWTNDPTSTIELSYAGPTTVRSGLRALDGVNAVLFNDPERVVSGIFDCEDGGILAMGGPFFYTSVATYRGQPFHEIIEADIITNDGAECFYRDNPAGTEEVLGHELGHTLGFSHSIEKDALMWAGAHDDGRGALLQADDRKAASIVYGDGSFQPPLPTAAGPQLSAVGTAKRSVRLSWKYSLQNAQAFRIEARLSDGAFAEVARVAGKARRTTLKGLSPGKVYVFRLQAILATGAVGEFSNEVWVQAKVRLN